VGVCLGRVRHHFEADGALSVHDDLHHSPKLRVLKRFEVITCCNASAGQVSCTDAQCHSVLKHMFNSYVQHAIVHGQCYESRNGKLHL
jgi:hypothetical protein